MNKETEDVYAKVLEERCGGNSEKESLYMFLLKLVDLFEIDLDQAEQIGKDYCSKIGSNKVSDTLIGIVKYGCDKKILNLVAPPGDGR